MTKTINPITRPISLDAMLAAANSIYAITPDDILGCRRHQSIVVVRRLIVALLYRFSHMSMQEAAHCVGYSSAASVRDAISWTHTSLPDNKVVSEVYQTLKNAGMRHETSL